MVTLLPQDFHPVVRQWWESRFGEPTAAQLDGWSAIRRGEHTLIAAPTGSGKTLAAFLTAIDSLFRENLEAGLPDEVRVIYVSPLKAHELIKVRAPSLDRHQRAEIFKQACLRTESELVQEVGKVAVLYKKWDTPTP